MDIEIDKQTCVFWEFYRNSRIIYVTHYVETNVVHQQQQQPITNEREPRNKSC